MVRAADRKEAGLDAPGDVPDDAMWHGRRRYHGRREEVLTDLTSADRDMDEMGGWWGPPGFGGAGVAE